MKKQAKESAYQYPSRFGSHKSMMVKEPDTDGRVVCKDEFGEYTTYANRLDSGTADPNRYTQNRIAKLSESKKKDDK